MEKLTQEFIEKNISLLGFGTMRFPLLDKNDDKSIDYELSQKMVDTYMESGFNYFDTAYGYHGGISEETVKKLVTSKYDRKSFVLATKLPPWFLKTKEDIPRVFNEQLQRCGVDYFDFYLLHALNAATFKQIEQQGAFEFVQEMKREGKIRFAGFSFHDTPDVLDDILTKHPEMEFVQLQINYLDWCNEIRSDEYYRIARKHNKPIIVMEPVKGGTLANLPQEVRKVLKLADVKASSASWAMRFCASLPGVMTILSGMSSMEQVEDNIKTLKNVKPLTAEEYKVIDSAVEQFKKIDMISCTDCKYCMSCPQNINIPEIFKISNNLTQSNDHAKAKNNYKEINDDVKANKCIECGLCESVCPQKIEIIAKLKVVHNKLM